MAFATVEDLEARWKPLTEEQEEVAEALLDDASALVSSQVQVDPDDDAQAALLKYVVCAMVKRAMTPSDSGAVGITQGSMSADIYSQSWTYSNPSGDLYLSATEKKALGIGAGFMGSIPAEIHAGWWM